MPTLIRTTAVWSGFIGSPGYTNFHWGPGGGSLTEGCDSATTAMRAFFDAIKALLPPTVQIQVQQECPLIDDATGHLTSVEASSAAPAVVLGTAAAGGVAAPAGASVIWLTGTVRATRQFRGRTFLVPMATNTMESNGTLTAAAIGTLNTASTALRGTAATPFRIWGRPNNVAQDNGISAAVVGQSVRDKVAVLRSRRD